VLWNSKYVFVLIKKYLDLSANYQTKTMRQLSILILLLCSSGFGYSKNPDYKEVTEKFITTYQYPVSDEEQYRINFAKKKDGWFVYKYYYLEEEQKERDFQLFWSNKNQKYLPLNFNLMEESDKYTVNIEDERSKYASSFSDYNYDRCIYAGYINWDIDIIKELENKKELSEQELESLARAYSNYAMGYLWAVYGTASDIEKTGRKPLDRCALPDLERAEKFAWYTKKGIEVFKQLKEKNPSFQTLVGDIQTKLSGEYIYTFTFLSYSGFDELAKTFIVDSLYDDYVIAYAKNYLQFLKKDAILFTQGDMDTYPLIYVQEKFGFRKDVTILNVGQLQLPAYLNYNKKKHPTILRDDFETYYCCTNADYIYLTDKSERDSSFYFHELYFNLLESALNCDKIDLSVPMFPGYKCIVQTLDPKTIKLPDYLYLSDLAELFIITNNLNKRPVYYGNTVESTMQDIFYPYTNNKGMAAEILNNSRPDEFPINIAAKTYGYRGYNTVDTNSVRNFLEKGDFRINSKHPALKTNAKAIELLYLQYASQLMQYISSLVEENQLQTARDMYVKHEEIFYFNTTHISYYLALLQVQLLVELNLLDKAKTTILEDFKNIEADTKTLDEQTVYYRKYFITQTEEIVKATKFPDKNRLLTQIEALKKKFDIN
jgi:hypothetical protein